MLLTTGTVRRKAWAQVATAPPTTLPATAPAVDARITFEDAIVLSNPLVRLEVSPAAGRIVHFGPTGGSNLLWINTERGVEKGPRRGDITYRNLGGDKIWPTLQVLWDKAYGGNAGQWPPDGIIDGQAWTLIDRSDRRVVMQSPSAAHLGIQVKREIELHETEPRVTIHNTITRHKANIFPVHVWTISQVRWPNHVLMDIADDRPTDQTWLAMGGKKVAERVELIGDAAAVRFEVDPKAGSNKVGTLGRWLAAVWDDHVWYQWTDFDPAGMYPDASSVQVYYDTNYTELELLSPMQHLQPGQTLSNTVTWWLAPKEEQSDQQIIQKAKQLSAAAASGDDQE